MSVPNPFQYDTAKDLDRESVVDLYIEDYNYSRFIQSKRNIYIVGERGSGKTMALLYNSLPIQMIKYERDKVKKTSYERVGVYVPCKTPLFQKAEYQLLSSFKASVVSEHYLVLEMIYRLAKTLESLPKEELEVVSDSIKEDIEYIFDNELPEKHGLLKSIMLYINREARRTQIHVNSPESEGYYEGSFGFASTVVPIINAIKSAPALKDAHFAFLIDDAHDLNEHQSKAINSWIAYRDHTDFSFKVASAKVGQPSYHTSSGGVILEGHDFIKIDMEQPFQNKDSAFAKLAEQIVQRRLLQFGIESTVEEFFPVNEQFEKDIELSKEAVRKAFVEANPDASPKQVRDHVYKFARVEYFRSRSPKANRPPYSGFETIVHLSTGVVRNLLEPCFWMFDDVVSDQPGANPSEIPSSVQSEVILERSRDMWKRLDDGLDCYISCTQAEAEQVKCLFGRLADLFEQRLLHHASEPRAITFSISARTPESDKVLLPLLDIARKAQMLYTRTSTTKVGGSQEEYYVPNRMLWPSRGLDPVGQHARVSLKAVDLIAAAIQDRPIPYQAGPSGQLDLEY